MQGVTSVLALPSDVRHIAEFVAAETAPLVYDFGKHGELVRTSPIKRQALLFVQEVTHDGMSHSDVTHTCVLVCRGRRAQRLHCMSLHWPHGSIEASCCL